ncbi:ead/Ea22-like family protein [Escherichia coli]
MAVDSISFDAVRVALNLVANMQRLEMTARFFIQRLEQSGISEQRRQPVSEIDYQALREAAERAIPAMERLLMLPVDDDLLSEQELKDYGVDIDALNAFKFLAGPETVLELLDERERNQQYIKRRDQENEDIALTVGKLRVELEGKDSKIANLTAERDALREGEMGDARHSNTRAAADIYFQLVEECEIPAGGSLVEYVDDMREKLESAEKRIAELEDREILLPERSSMLHRTDFHDDYQTVMAYKVSEVIAAIRAAGIRIKGE